MTTLSPAPTVQEPTVQERTAGGFPSRWGPDDQAGALNEITPATVRGGRPRAHGAGARPGTRAARRRPGVSRAHLPVVPDDQLPLHQRAPSVRWPRGAGAQRGELGGGAD